MAAVLGHDAGGGRVVPVCGGGDGGGGSGGGVGTARWVRAPGVSVLAGRDVKMIVFDIDDNYRIDTFQLFSLLLSLLLLLLMSLLQIIILTVRTMDDEC